VRSFIPGIGHVAIGGYLLFLLASAGLGAAGGALSSVGIPKDGVPKYEADLRANRFRSRAMRADSSSPTCAATRSNPTDSASCSTASSATRTGVVGARRQVAPLAGEPDPTVRRRSGEPELFHDESPRASAAGVSHGVDLTQGSQMLGRWSAAAVRWRRDLEVVHHDDWDDQRQVCIDVLCASLRMPYEPDTTSEKHREGEREVRHTIIRIIRDHLRDPSAPTTWCGRDLDFTNATFDGGNFTGAKFIGSEVSFTDAKFTGGGVSFTHAKFTGGKVYCTGAKFTDGEVSFGGAEYAGGNVSFDDAKFTISSSITLVPFKFVEFTTGCSITWGPFKPPATWAALQATWAALQENERRQNEPPLYGNSAVTLSSVLGSCGASRQRRRDQ
jgi:pentapeptide repeat protein